MRIIDFHTHAFPDPVAQRIMPKLNEEAESPAVLDGTLSSLLASMDKAAIEKAVLGSIATKPEQFKPILKWSKAIASERILPFPSVLPADPQAVERAYIIAEEGFKGIKLHPQFQGFRLDDEPLFPFFKALEQTGLLVLMHTGFDMAFERIRVADPVRIVKVLDAFPDLKLITTHFGAWKDWDEVRKHLLGKPIYTDVSYSIQFMPKEEARELVLGHPRDYVLFGTDSPWAGQRETIEYVRSLELGPEWERSVFFDNAARLLGIE